MCSDVRRGAKQLEKIARDVIKGNWEVQGACVCLCLCVVVCSVHSPARLGMHLLVVVMVTVVDEVCLEMHMGAKLVSVVVCNAAQGACVVCGAYMLVLRLLPVPFGSSCVCARGPRSLVWSWPWWW